MEKICIVKLRKKMTSPAGLGEECPRGDDTQEDFRYQRPCPSGAEEQQGQDTKGPDAGELENREGRIHAVEGVVALKLTREQMKQLQSQPSVLSALRDRVSAECNAVRHTDESVVIKFEFDALPPLRLLTVEEVIHMLRISKSSLNRAIKEGDLTSYRFGRRRRFMFDDILSYLEAHQEIPAAGEQDSESRGCSKEIV